MDTHLEPSLTLWAGRETAVGSLITCFQSRRHRFPIKEGAPPVRLETSLPVTWAVSFKWWVFFFFFSNFKLFPEEFLVLLTPLVTKSS